jgi:hypothetical protein
MLNLHSKKKNSYQQYYQIYLLCILLVFIILILSIINLIDYFSTRTYFETLQIYNVHKSTYLSSDKEIVFHLHNHTIHYIYIDIGCFNGETIEHFIYFNPDSINYDIITFEPDPINYQLCKNRLTQDKYQNYHIFIIPKIVWIRNEKLSYYIDHGQRSRIDLSKTSLIKLDAIDFSSWLTQFIPLNNTKLHIKLSMPGAENLLLEKMILDDTLALPNKWDVEWTINADRRTLPVRYYVQSMFNALGYDWRYLTCLRDRRQIFKMKGTEENITKYLNLNNIAHLEIFFHYVQRTDRTTNKFKQS